MNLPEALRQQKETFIRSAQPETLQIMNNAREDLFKSGIGKNSLQPGDKAIDFILEDAFRQSVKLSDYLNKKAVILKFFRGDW